MIMMMTFNTEKIMTLFIFSVSAKPSLVKSSPNKERVCEYLLCRLSSIRTKTG